jgi:hypothetical protein
VVEGTHLLDQHVQVLRELGGKACHSITLSVLTAQRHDIEILPTETYNVHLREYLSFRDPYRGP